METSRLVLDFINAIAWPVAVVVVVFFVIRLAYPLLTNISLRGYPTGEFQVRLRELQDRIEGIELPQRVQEALAKKRDRMLNIPNVSFHYADKERITNFYNDYFKEPTIENVVSEMATEISADVTGKLPKVLEAKAGGKNLSKWISTIKLPETSLNGMFRRYQRETIRNDQVRLDIELVDVELSDLQKFESLVRELIDRFGVEIETDILEKHRASLKQKTAEKTLKKLETVSGWVLVEGSFNISEIDGKFYSLKSQHPISEFLEGAGKDVNLTILVPQANIESHVAGSYAQSIGKTIPLRVYGEVWRPLDRVNEEWEVQITPLAVY